MGWLVWYGGDVLAHTLVNADSRPPTKAMIFLHGILGTRANWRTIARRFTGQRDDWAAVLIDLREHGESLDRLPPHTVRAAAEDLVELEHEIDLPVRGVLGHSFGGKVALQWLSQHRDIEEAWIIDSSPSRSAPSSDPDATTSVLDTLERVPRTFASRAEFVDAIVAEGQPAPIAQWLAKNLQREESGVRFGPELPAIRELIADYRKTDSWSIVEDWHGDGDLRFVVGGRSNALGASDRARLATLATENSHVFMHVIEEAGHWVHIDSPDAIVALLTSKRTTQP